MSKVSYPDTNNVGNNYPYNYSSVDGGEGYGMDPRIQAWAQQAQSYKTMYKQYLQNLSQGGIDTSERQAYQTVMGYLNQLNGQLSEYGIDVGGWDPLMGEGFGGGYESFGEADLNGGEVRGAKPSANPGLQADYTDQQKLIFGELEEVSSFNTDKNVPQSEVRFANYGEMTFNIPGAATANISYENGMVVAKVRWPLPSPDGTTKTYYFEKNKKVIFVSGDSERQVTLDASVPAGKVEKKGVGDKKDDKVAVKGDAPTGEKDGKEEWDLPNATIYPSGDGKEKNIFVSENLTFKAASTRDYWTVEWDATKKVYVVKVYEDSAKSKMKNTYIVDEMVDKVFFGKDIEASHIEFLGALADPSDSHKPNPTTPEGQKIFVGTDSATAALNETKKVEYPDGLKSLLDGKKDQEILDALKAAGYTALKTIEDFRKAVADGEFLTSLPEKKLIKFLAQFDGDFKSALNKASFSQTFDEKQANLQTAAERLNELLGKLYPENKISDPSGYASGNESAINLMFDGQSVSIDMTKSNYMEVTVSAPWPKESEILGNLPNADSHDWAVDLTSVIMKGVNAHNPSSPLWKDVTTFLNRDGDHVNDALRSLMTGIYNTAGSDEKKFKELLKAIPENVRQHMVNILRSNEKFEKHGDEQWDSTTTAALIQETI